MNWVWANSPTLGNERLVLLALADACSRDDGTGCWPSAATIARKANVSDRTVRRVIARLEAGGHVRVHRGGGRAGATNSYTVIAGAYSPGQTVTPNILSGGDSGDTPPRTQPYQGTPDTAVSPEPPPNHQETARRAPARAARAQPNRRSSCTRNGARPHRRKQANVISGDSFNARSCRKWCVALPDGHARWRISMHSS
jgi:hypothetical protein